MFYLNKSNRFVMSRNPIDLRKGVTTCEVLSPYYLTSLNMRSTIPAKIRHVNLLFSQLPKIFSQLGKKSLLFILLQLENKIFICCGDFLCLYLQFTYEIRLFVPPACLVAHRVHPAPRRHPE